MLSLVMGGFTAVISIYLDETMENTSFEKAEQNLLFIKRN